MEKITIFISCISLSLSAVSILFVFLDYIGNRKKDKIKYLLDLISNFNDSNLLEVFSLIDLSEINGWYTDDSFYEKTTREFNIKIDTLLWNLSTICYIEKKGFVKIKDLDNIHYYLDRVLKSNDTICYLWNIYHYSKKFSITPPFICLIEYAEKNGYINRDFFESESQIYTRRLNF